MVESVLGNSSIGYVDTLNNSTAYTRYNMPEYASMAGAKYHVILSFKENQKPTASYNRDGWTVYYKSADGSAGVSAELAAKIAESLRADSDLAEASSIVNNVTFNGCRSIEEYFGNNYTFPIFNYTQVPTVLVVFNSGMSDNNNEKIGACIATSLGGGEE